MLSRRLGFWIEPEDAYISGFASHPRSFWLDSGPDARMGRSYVGAGEQLVTAAVAGRTVTVSTGGSSETVRGTIFDHLRSSPGVTRVGWLGYELGAQTVGTPWHPSSYPDAAMIEVDRMLEFDHTNRTVTAFESDRWGTPSFGWLETLVPMRDAALHDPSTAPGATGTPAWRHDAESYVRLIERCQDAIRRGEAYQLCLTNQVSVPGEFDPVDVFRRLRGASPSHHGGLIRCDGVALVSSSPEVFLRVTGDVISTSPIKGTRRRGATPSEDDSLRADLLASDKERAENLMIVDLMRNDLTRVAEVGSVRVARLLEVERYAQVHQLVSTVEATLSQRADAVDVVEACFPAGSMTGAPKISAITLLHEFEGGQRGVYAGAFGILGADGSVDLAMTIRSIVIDRAGATIGTGGGITALSVASDEVDETRVKAEAMLASLGC